MYDVIVIGCGHAGCEAAAASARLGASTLLLSMNIDNIAWMPCNPAVGGPAKSHLVKEIDALDGLMGLAADATYLQLKLLNSSRGAAVHALRAQSDKYAYSRWMAARLSRTPNLSFYQGSAVGLLVEQDVVRGVRTSLGEEIRCKSVVITSGTFLGGKVFTGKISRSSGRAAEPAAEGLTECLQSYGITFGRLKTGTPPRIDSRSVNFSCLGVHPGDAKVQFFSFMPERPQRIQLDCHSTRTTETTHQIIRDNLHLSPMHAGLIEGIGPRYCPSIEDKVVRFADKDSHLLFLEPESLDTSEIYLQGCSTGLPPEVQVKVVRSLPGLEQAHIVRPAYAVEYDFLHPYQCKATLEIKAIEGLYAAGQLLGTSGYEEAAAQGLVAGANAAAKILGREPFVLSRSESYIGSLIDDLITKDITEPYRMLTARSEHRLYLRQDNAYRRLTPVGRFHGLVKDSRWKVFEVLQAAFDDEIKLLNSCKVADYKHNYQNFESLNIVGNPSLIEILARNDVDYSIIDALLNRLHSPEVPRSEVETEVKYAGYVRRAKQQSEQLKRLENRTLPTDLNYLELKHLSLEAREKLNKIKPNTIGQASLIDGVSPADIRVLSLCLGR